MSHERAKSVFNILRGGRRLAVLIPGLNARLRASEPALLIALGALIGVFTGFVTVGYRLAVHSGNRMLLEGVLHHEGEEHIVLSALMRLFLPAAGALVVALVLARLHRPRPLMGVPAVLRAMHTGRVKLPVSMAAPSACSVAILATGGSAGPEGPIAEIGSVMGAGAGEALKLPARMLRTLVASGVAAGIASVFNTPLGGVFFAIEVILQEYQLASFAPVLMASVASSVVTHIFLGNLPAIAAPEFSSSLHEIPFYCVLGAVTGALSIAFIRLIDLVGRRFALWKAPLWARAAAGGLAVGLIGLFLPAVMGEGYGFLNAAMAHEEIILPFFGAPSQESGLILFFLALAMAKMLATSLTLGSGSPGGSFAPGVFVGVAAGMSLGFFFQWMWPTLEADPAAYGFMGMAGMIAGMFNAPMTAIMIVYRQAEGNAQILLPLMSTVALSVFVMHRWRNVSVYTMTLERLGLPWGQEEVRDPLLGTTVADAYSPDFLTLSENQTVAGALDLLRETDQTVFVVRGADGRGKGVLSISDLRLAFQDREMSHLLTLGDLADPFAPRLLVSTSLRDAITLFSQTEREGVAVYRSEGEAWPVGIVTRAAILRAYRARQSASSANGSTRPSG